MLIRPEQDGDAPQIRALTERAFAGHLHSNGSEPRIIEDLRATGALSVSMVALIDSEIVGHVAFSPVDWCGQPLWFGLGPLSIAPSVQRQGIGRNLAFHGLARLRANGASGSVVLGPPLYYGGLGFKADPRWTFAGAPEDHFMAQVFVTPPDDAAGPVRYHSAFG